MIIQIILKISLCCEKSYFCKRIVSKQLSKIQPTLINPQIIWTRRYSMLSSSRFWSISLSTSSASSSSEVTVVIASSERNHGTWIQLAVEDGDHLLLAFFVLPDRRRSLDTVKRKKLSRKIWFLRKGNTQLNPKEKRNKKDNLWKIK